MLGNLCGVSISDGRGTRGGEGGQTGKEDLTVSVGLVFVYLFAMGPLLFSLSFRWSKTYQERAQLLRRVVEAADDAKTEDGDDSHGIRVNCERPTAKAICRHCSGKHGDELHTGQDDRYHERVGASRLLDYGRGGGC